MNNPVYLDRNENHYGPSPACAEVLKTIRGGDLATYPREYTRGVKSRLSERLARDLSLPESQILLSEGSEDMLKQVVHCYLGVGEVMLCPQQSWWYYQAVASEVGGVTMTFPLKERGNQFHYDVQRIEEAYWKHQPKVLLLASPNNPTGNSLSVADLKRILGFARNSIVVLDEAYWGFDGVLTQSNLQMVREHQNLIIIRSFSKLFALAGARIAFAAVGHDVTSLTKFAARYLGYNRISELLALAALDSMEYYAGVSARIRAERQLFYDFFSKRDDFTAFISDANFVLVRISSEDRERLKKHLESDGIFIKFFSADHTGLSDYVRITVGTPEQNKRLLNSIALFLKSQAHVSP
ncbi:MAG TPA: aminotransferase class I/II-fold pyridoxal phosphate-dependent enzyme [Bacteroidota bacterium]|nr:aminotransferase class I/II-fold pyridoxal phosphate-dependent enzyme [Bacteroidota bacterium]